MKSILSAILMTSCLIACSGQRYFSRTIINPRETFILGDGNHGSYSASIFNDCNVPVKIYTANRDSLQEMITILEPGQQASLEIGADQKVMVKNENQKQAVVKLRLKPTQKTGSLSMGYTANE